jgi:hypothetical protein
VLGGTKLGFRFLIPTLKVFTAMNQPQVSILIFTHKSIPFGEFLKFNGFQVFLFSLGYEKVFAATL